MTNHISIVSPDYEAGYDAALDRKDRWAPAKQVTPRQCRNWLAGYDKATSEIAALKNRKAA